MCLAPRAVGQLGSYSEAFQASQSIIQGLRSGTRFGRCLVYFILQKLTRATPDMSFRIWIDDLTQHYAGSRKAVCANLHRGIPATCQELEGH
eukprot:3091665-Pyramimonas_sp.AAC.1